MDEKKRIYKWYLLTVITYTVFSALLQSYFFFNYDNISNIEHIIYSMVSFIWLCFNIALFITIIIEKIEKVALLIPGLIILEYVLGFIAGIILFIMILNNSNNLNAITQHPAFAGLIFIFPIIILTISIKLLLRK